MAERRMFSRSIINSDAFSSLPARTQNLYFHYCLEADDEGFVDNTKTIRSMVGATINEHQQLVGRGFLIEFDNGVAVVKHWRKHNRMRADRSKDTMYQTEKSRLNTTQDGIYVMRECQPKRNQSAHNVVAQESKGEEREEEDSIVKAVPTPAGRRPIALCGTYKNIVLYQDEYDDFVASTSKAIDAVNYLSQYIHDQKKYVHNPLQALQTWVLEAVES